MQKIGLKYLKVICVSKVPKTASLAKLQFVIQALLKIVIATAEINVVIATVTQFI